ARGPAFSRHLVQSPYRGVTRRNAMNVAQHELTRWSVLIAPARPRTEVSYFVDGPTKEGRLERREVRLTFRDEGKTVGHWPGAATRRLAVGQSDGRPGRLGPERGPVSAGGNQPGSILQIWQPRARKPGSRSRSSHHSPSRNFNTLHAL